MSVAGWNLVTTISVGSSSPRPASAVADSIRCCTAASRSANSAVRAVSSLIPSAMGPHDPGKASGDGGTTVGEQLIAFERAPPGILDDHPRGLQLTAGS